MSVFTERRIANLTSGSTLALNREMSSLITEEAFNNLSTNQINGTRKK
ncbi:MAG: hypothetical protein M3388_05760 [Acidobacteriota bacterium]|nr:hypothetical protein [Acidobacteriota bacterium]